MLTGPAEWLPLLGAWAPLFSKPVWVHAPVLVVGALLAPGHRTVTACWRVMGWSQEPCCVNEPRVLHRARWSLWAASPRWLRWLGARFAPAEEWGCGLADPIERRRGEPSAATGLYRAPGRAAQAPLGKARGWRGRWWRLLGQVAWAGAMGGLPCLTGLCCGL